jgi:uncharacterized protein (DUF1501 family)
MDVAVNEITNNLLTEGLFAVCPACRFFDKYYKNGKVKYVCAVSYPHENLPCWDTFQDYLRTGKSFYIPADEW